MLHSGSRITAERYKTSLNSFCRFLGHASDVPFPEFTSPLLQSYERWLHLQGITANTSSFYLRNLRAVFNRAVADGVAAASSPFSQVFTGVSKTVKRAVDIDTLRALKCMSLPAGSPADLARSLFFFSFYTRGMSFVDMAFLRKSDVADGRSPHLLPSEDASSAQHPLGNAHAAYCRGFRDLAVSLSASHHPSSRRQSSESVHQCPSVCQPPSPCPWRMSGAKGPAYHVCGTPQLGEHSAWKPGACGRHQRGLGAYVRAYHPHLSRIV